jgi:tripartite-type tricarboxylate transporter receptor subunit TctC
MKGVIAHARIRVALAAAGVLCFAGWAGAQTENYPTRPVRVISPFPAGGSVDLVARMVSAKLGESLGQQVIVDNRSGASGNIGAEVTARAAPDGYTLMVHTIPFVANTFLYQRVPYDPLNDFAPVSLLTSSPSLLTVHPSVPVRSVRELLALARSQPGALNYASAGIGTNPHIAGELFNYLGKVNIVAVHFKGGGPGLIAAVSGEVGITFTNFSETSTLVKAGKLRALGVSSAKRAAAMPEIPAIAEALPGYEFVTWHGMLAPKATPRNIVVMLSDRIRKTMNAPDQMQRYRERGLDVIASTPDEFAAHLKSELQKWGSVIRERSMRAE